MVEHAIDHRRGVGLSKARRRGNRTGGKAGAAARAGIEHVIDAPGKGFFEPGILHEGQRHDNRPLLIRRTQNWATSSERSECLHYMVNKVSVWKHLALGSG